MAKLVSLSVIDQMHQIQQGLASGGFDESMVRARLQAIIEKRSLSESSLSTRRMFEHEGVEISEDFLAQTMVYYGQKLKRHRNGGGWVPLHQDEHDQDKPFVALSAYVGPFAMVYGKARATGRAHIKDCARVFGLARVTGTVMVSDRAQVFGSVFLSEGWISGDTEVCR